ncbi:MAG: hypothetical protein R3C49_22750 [Planctomycetaceae bacterium]
MTWYQALNAVEAGLWGLVAVWILLKVPAETVQRRRGVRIGFVAFLAFGLSDAFEVFHEARIPLWLWGHKIACGCAILCARFTWLGWDRFHWRRREVLFAGFCLIAVLLLILLQRLSSAESRL